MHGARTIRAGRIGEWRVVVSRGNYRRSIGEFSRKREKIGDNIKRFGIRLEQLQNERFEFRDSIVKSANACLRALMLQSFARRSVVENARSDSARWKLVDGQPWPCIVRQSFRPITVVPALKER